MKTGQALRGSLRLGFEAVAQTTTIVEQMYRNIASASPMIGAAPEGPARGIAGLVHESVRQVSGLIGSGTDQLIAPFVEQLDERAPPGPGREAVVAALNGVLGDHLEASGNPLAIRTRLRHDGQDLLLDTESLKTQIGKPSRDLLIQIHGLCMSDGQWTHKGHNHGRALAEKHGYTALQLRYNSGRHISENGRDLAELLDVLMQEWPVPVRSIRLLGHSMGGLVARSAVHQAEAAGFSWRRRLQAMAFLGTPHHGAPMERHGHTLNTLAAVSPYTAPLARLGWLRSAGITDLRHANLQREDWDGRDRFADDDRLPDVIPLPDDVRCIAVAATLGAQPGELRDRMLGDGLVPLSSALGRHHEPLRCLRLEHDCSLLRTGLNHWDLLDDAQVCEFLLQQLGPRRH